MSCCDINEELNLPENKKKIVLAGNPNVGKSIFFNDLTGVYVSVSNYPGTTLDISKGEYKDNIVLDTPGVYGVSSFNDEEVVARDVIMSADVVINVVDAVHLERDLFLTQQLIDMQIPVIVALNMMDEADKNGLNINTEKLSEELGVPVIPTIAPKGEGLERLKDLINTAARGNECLKEKTNIKDDIADIYQRTDNYPESVLIAEGDEEIAKKHNLEPYSNREEIYKTRRERVNELINVTVKRQEQPNSFKAKLGSWMLKPKTGIPILLGMMYLLYEFIGVFIAQTVVGITEETIFIETYEPFIRRMIGGLLSAESLLGQLLIGEFGLLTMVMTYTFGLLLPLVVGFYLFISLLEDSGYMPRIAALVDRLLNKVGLNGRAIIPMLLGFGCVTMATITTRMLGSKREKMIAVFLLGLAIPCSAQLGVIAGLIAPLGIQYFVFYVLTIFLVYVLSGTFLNRVLPGESSDLLIDLPPLRVPSLSNVMQKTYNKSKSFIVEAGPIFGIGAVLITLMERYGLLAAIEKAIAPLVEGWMKLPAETARVFIMGIVRRDFGAAGLTSMALSPEQTTVALITITLFVPCIAAMMIMVKERDIKEAIYIWFGSWITAIGVGGITAQILL